MLHLLHEGFFKKAVETPNATALILGEREFSYQQLSEKASRIAAELVFRGVGRSDRICIFGNKSFEVYAAILGILKCGACYIPLDPEYPAERLSMIVETAAPSLLLSSGPLSSELKALCSEGCTHMDILNLAGRRSLADSSISGPNPSDLAYILFTSGSTGVPKGVMITHANATAFVNWGIAYFGISNTDILSGHSDLSFDLSVFDTFVALSAGATLIPVIGFFERLAPGEFIKANAISIWFSVPSVITGMTAIGEIKPEYLQGLRWMAFCGEALRPGVVEKLRHIKPDLKIANLYGPTEATVSCSAYEIPFPAVILADGISIGWKTAQTEVFIWHETGRLAEIGEIGEIYIAGDQVSPGYFRRQDDTHNHFVQDPRDPETSVRCFKTGDLARVLNEGPFFTGRVDSQIKYKGFRIELGDIEHALASVGGVTECAAALITLDDESEKYVAFVTGGASLSTKEVIKELKEKVPTYMVPTHIRVIDDFPRTLNKKIDRKRLKELL